MFNSIDCFTKRVYKSFTKRALISLQNIFSVIFKNKLLYNVNIYIYIHHKENLYKIIKMNKTTIIYYTLDDT